MYGINEQRKDDNITLILLKDFLSDHALKQYISKSYESASINPVHVILVQNILING